MQNNILEIDLTKNHGTDISVNDVALELDRLQDKNLFIDLKFNDIEVSQSQMIFIKSLIESYGHKLNFVQTTNPVTKNVCSEIGISSKDCLENKNSLDKTTENKKESIKQVIGVYRKADESENEEEFKEEDVDFYATKTDEPVVVDTKDTMYINQTLRNGQIIDYDGNVVIIGDCHPGSEIKATGDITVWGVLGAIAHAGIKGNKEARIRALKMNAIQLRIADCYSRRPDIGNIPYVAKTSEFTPEEARIVDDNIVLYKMARN